MMRTIGHVLQGTALGALIAFGSGCESQQEEQQERIEENVDQRAEEAQERIEQRAEALEERSEHVQEQREDMREQRQETAEEVRELREDVREEGAERREDAVNDDQAVRTLEAAQQETARQRQGSRENVTARIPERSNVRTGANAPPSGPNALGTPVLGPPNQPARNTTGTDTAH